MFQLFARLPAILLAIILGISFHQGVAAGSESAGHLSAHLNHMKDLSGADLKSASESISIQEAGGSDGNDNADDQSCSSGHCASCVLAISPDVVSSEKYTSISIIPLNTSDFVSHISSSLFRPPKM